MKKIFRYFSILNSHFSSPKGFSLIEMLVVFSIIGVTMAGSMAAFYTYNTSQSFRSAVSDVKQELSQARSRAISQTKPTVCGTRKLEGYEFWHASSGTSYRLRVRCGGNYYTLVTKPLPANISFGTSTTTFFAVSTGTIASTRNIVINGYGKTNTIRIETTGSISVQ